jgi:hypothetical protein
MPHETRVCAGCHREKHLGQFALDKHHPSGTGRGDWCYECARGDYKEQHRAAARSHWSRSRTYTPTTELRRQLRAMVREEMRRDHLKLLAADPDYDARIERERDRVTTTLKVCVNCGAEKPLVDYPKNVRCPDRTGYDSFCRACVKADPEGTAKLDKRRWHDRHVYLKNHDPAKYRERYRQSNRRQAAKRPVTPAPVRTAADDAADVARYIRTHGGRES